MNNKSTWIKNPLAVHCDSDASGGIVVQNSKIVEILKYSQKPKIKIDEVFDASDSVVLPGLINTHHHFYQTLTRAYPSALNKDLFPWLKALYLVWSKIDEEMIEISTKLALCELMLSGCTTTSDHHYLFSEQTKNAIDIQAKVAKELKMRVVLTRGSMSLGEKDGGLPPDVVVQSEDEILQDSQRLINSYHDDSIGSMMQIALAPCSPFSVSTELMKQSALMAKENNVLLHTHLAETIDEENFCLEKFGLRTVDYLESVGWLGDNTWLAHGIHFNDDEIKALGKAKVGISHCPSSNMMLSSGIARSLELEKAGCSFGIGVDGSASNDCSNMIGELRQAMYLQRLKYGAKNISHQKVYDWGSKSGASLFKRSQDLGSISIGKQADLAFFKLDELRFSGSGDPLAALLLCGAHKADALMINGEFRVKDGDLIGVDIEKLQYMHSKLAKKLL